MFKFGQLLISPPLGIVWVLFSFIKKILEFRRLFDVLTNKGNNLSKNVKTRWINMISCIKHIMEQYCALIANMHDDVLRNNIGIHNLSLFCDLELILGLHAIFPLLHCVHTLIKFVQSCDIFMCDFIDAMKIYQLEPHYSYNNIFIEFDELNSL
jgi:hypothetical protein